MVEDAVPRRLLDERFDVMATAETDVPLTSARTLGPMNRMVQTLLADRFNMIARFEQRERQTYVLILARSDGRLGPQLRPSTIDCAARMANLDGPPPTLEEALEEAKLCAIVRRNSRMQARGHHMSQIAEYFARRLQQPVVDATGLTGPFEVEMTFGQEGLPGIGIPPPGPPRQPSSPTPPTAPSAPSLFTALPEQLGLRLESQRRPVPVLVIERLESPTEN
jgi:uncharacterized protein (TIGR03435 family)